MGGPLEKQRHYTRQEIKLTEQDYLGHIETIAKDSYIAALKDLPADVKAALDRAFETEQSERGKVIMQTILKNIEVAETDSMLICQDTGLPIYYVWLDPEINISLNKIMSAIKKGCASATIDFPLRSNAVHPITRKNNGDNTGTLMPHIYFYENQPGEGITIKALPKGSGSENMSFIKMLTPADGIQAIKKFVMECVLEAGPKPCPPTVIGVGIGGTSDLCMSLAKKAVARPVGSSSDDPDIAKLERELFSLINELGIGPMGLGGSNTTLGVNIEYAYTHISMNPVAVNFQCWPARRSTARLSKDGSITYEDE